MRKSPTILITILALLAVGGGRAGEPAPPPADPALGLLPQPVKVVAGRGTFRLAATAAVAAAAECQGAAGLLAADLRQATGMPVPVRGQATAGDIRLVLDPSLTTLAAEGYRLTVRADGVGITAASAAGLFYGGRTLLQLLPSAGTEAGIRIAEVAIEDGPRFAWRGLMLDCSRTFQSIGYLKQTIDRLAFYKMNVLHLHLTDDQGWRVEIRKHPELTERGARFSEKYHEPESHQGFYTQTALRDLVNYAGLRGITIVPEIEMPGHSRALLVCHPELSCAGTIADDIFPFGKGPNITTEILCAGNDDTFKLMEEVLDEIIGVFPSKFIHIGGDEAPKESWKTCSKCQTRIKAEGLKNESELQSYFIRRIEKHLNARGRRLIGWSEILQGGLAPNAAVMDWIGGAAQAANAGHDVVRSPTSHCYFDYPYDLIDTRRAYGFDPLAGLDEAQAKHVLGLQANFWSHIDREPQKVDAQLFPRLLGLAERAWSPAAANDWADFAARTKIQLIRLDEMNVSWHRGERALMDEPVGRWEPATVGQEYQPLVWDISDRIMRTATLEVTFDYQRGAFRLGIEQLDLLVDGKVVSSDRHRGTTGTVDEDNSYKISLQSFKQGARYELRASVRGEGGTDSSGAVHLRVIQTP
jgi:hexosaminidase